MAGVQLNSVFIFSPSQAVNESRIFEQEYHILRYFGDHVRKLYKTHFINFSGIIVMHRQDVSDFVHIQLFRVPGVTQAPNVKASQYLKQKDKK